MGNIFAENWAKAAARAVPTWAELMAYLASDAIPTSPDSSVVHVLVAIRSFAGMTASGPAYNTELEQYPSSPVALVQDVLTDLDVLLAHEGCALKVYETDNGSLAAAAYGLGAVCRGRGLELAAVDQEADMLVAIGRQDDRTVVVMLSAQLVRHYTG